MPKMKVLIELEQTVWDAIPQVARYLQLPSDAQSPTTIEAILEHFILETLFESGVSPKDLPSVHPDEALQALLDPDVSIPLKELATWAGGNDVARKTLLEEFDELALHFPSDQWILMVLQKPESEQPLWKAALAATYSVVSQPDRRLSMTWNLIARTYVMMTGK